MSLLEARGLGVPAPRGDQRAPLRGPIDLSIRPDMVLVVTGASGSGKSTLLRALALLEPFSQGEVMLRGRRVEDGQVPLFRRQISYVPQALPRPPVTVEAFLRRPFELAVARGSRFDRGHAEQLLGELGLAAGMLGRSLPELSGGEAQRVGMVRSFLVRPVVLLLDEPTSALDVASREAVEGALMRWLRDREQPERAAVIATHDVGQLERLATHHCRFSPERELSPLANVRAEAP